MNPNQTDFNANLSDAIEHFGCENGSDPCALGTKVSGDGPNSAELDTNP